MRVTGNQDDPSYGPEAAWSIVYLDGARMQNVVIADEESRAVVVEVLDDAGRPVLRDDRIALRVLVGEVAVRFSADSPPWLREEHPDRIEARP